MGRMRYVSLFSGVEAASLAFEPLGWEPVAFCEVDEFASAVLAHRWPGVPNLGDIRDVDWSDFRERYGAVDLVCGGSPCTSFSIAGGRQSLSGESRLMFEYLRAVRELRAPWFVWENVPGVLSARDNAFGQLLREVDDIGYHDVAWRVLDAQFARVPVRDGDGRITGWFGPVAQRRRRLFLVGRLGDGFRSAAVLFEPSSCGGDNQAPSSKKMREAIAADAREGAGGDGGEGVGPLCMASNHTNAEICDGMAPTLLSHMQKDAPIVIDRAAYNQGANAKYPPT